MNPVMKLPREHSPQYRFSFDLWNISGGADHFDSKVRNIFPHEETFALYRPLGFEGMPLRKVSTNQPSR